MKVQILRDTDYSFIKTSKKENGDTFSRKIEKGMPEYGNACNSFHSKGVNIGIGNKIEK